MYFEKYYNNNNSYLFNTFNQNAEIEPYKSLGETLRNQRPSLTMANLTEKLYDVLLELNGAYASVTYLLKNLKYVTE